MTTARTSRTTRSGKPPRWPKTRDAGSALVELALVLPIFSLLLVGASEFASLEYDSIEVTSAARAGVAYGSQSATQAADITGMENAAVDDGPDVGGITASCNGVSKHGLCAVAKQFWSCSDAPSTQASSPPTCAQGTHVLHYVQVKTTATVDPTVHIPALPGSYALTGLVIMRVQ